MTEDIKWGTNNNPEEVKKSFLEYIKYFSLTETDLKKPLLDVGTGNGYFIDYIRNTLGNTQAYGIEKDVQKIKNNMEGIVAGDGLSIPFPDNAFEIVTAKNYLPMFFDNEEKTRQAISELVRVTKPGGKIMADVTSPTEALHDLNNEQPFKNLNDEQIKEMGIWLAKKYGGSILFQEILRDLKAKGYAILPEICPKEKYVVSINKPN